MRDPRRFWDRWADRYARMPVPDEAAYRAKLAATQAWLTPDAELFEFGCGTGSTAIAHAPHVAHVHAMDVSPRMLDIARRKAASAGVANVTFAQGDILRDAPDRRFDMVLGLSILHLLPDRRAGIDGAAALLKPGGLFVTSTVCLADMPPWVRLVAQAGSAVGVFPLLRAFPARDLVHDMEAAGLTIVHHFQPGPRKALFLIAQARGAEAAIRRPDSLEAAQAGV